MARLRGSRARMLAITATLALVAGVLVESPIVRRAAALADIQVTQSIPANTLIGNSTSVELTITNSGDTPAYNLTLALRLPMGVSVGSAAEPPTRIITETNAAGTPTGTVTVWENVVDVRPGGVLHVNYTLEHVVGTGQDQWSVGDTFSAPISVYVSDDKAVRPTVQPDGTANPVSAVADPASFDDSSTATGSSTLVPLLVSKTEPSPENELLRGVHDNQTVYTLSARTGSEGGVAVSTVDDWLPAGLEFLGCGIEDNSTIGEEYPGSGPLNPGNAPPLSATCTPPTLVETVVGAPPAATGLASPPAGVYTHVQWTLNTTLPADSTQYFSYVVGIPMRANTVAWPNGQPTPESGDQGSNLDNNNGPLTTQVGAGQTFTNYAQGQTTFQGTPFRVQATETVKAMDTAVYKTVSDPSVNQGEVSTWTMHIRTSEYVTDGGVDVFVLTDTSPDGTCPILSVNPRCTSTTAPGPSIPYSSTTYDAATGQTNLTWDLSDRLLGGNQELLVSYSTLALATYVDGSPVSAKDSWRNDVDLGAHVQTFFTPPFDNDTIDNANNDVTDDSSATQAGDGIVFTKEVGHPPPGADCGNGANVSWSSSSTDDLGPGDLVCFRLTGRAPPNLDVIRASFTDFLPVGFEFVVGSSGPGPDNELDPSVVAPVTVAGTADTGQRLDWRLNAGATVDPSLTAQVVFAAQIAGSAPPDLGTSGDLLVNNARATYENSQGEIFVAPDNATVVFSEAHLTLDKLITARNGVPISPGVEQLGNIVGGDRVTYTLTVTNDGTRDANDAVVRDLLPVNEDGIAGVDAVCAELTAIAPAATCAGDDLEWTGLTIPAGGSIALTYTWTLPTPEPASSSWRNEAGVVEYQSDTNRGGSFTYVPRDNIDPAREPEANTDPARDDAVISSPGVQLTKTRTTSITEAGNNTASQATIGETIRYTVTARQAGGTTIDNALLVDDLTGRGQDVVAASVSAGYGSAATGEPCPTTLTPLPIYNPSLPVFPSIEVADDTITIRGPAGDLSANPDDICVVLTYDVVVRDAPIAAEPLNKRPNSLTNTAVVTFDVGDESRTATASVSTQIVEPNIRITKRSDASLTVTPSQAVTYQLVVTNSSAAQVSTAHNVSVVDQLPAQVASVTDPGGGTVNGATISWTVPALAPGASTTLTYSVTLVSPLVAGTTITNDAGVEVTSLADPLAGRTAGSACSPASCPGYESQASVTLTVAGPSLAKETTPTVDTIGAIQTYTLRATLPAHLDYGNAVMTLTDDLAVGRTTFVRTVGMNCLLCSPTERDAFVAPEDNGTATAASPRWDLAVFGPSDFTRSVVIVFEARVRDITSNIAGATLTNTATLGYTNGTLQATAAMRLAEPTLTLTKEVAGTVGDTTLQTTTPSTPVQGEPGSQISYRLTITNTGGWTAYDTVVQDEPDVVSSGGSCTGTSRLTALDFTPNPLVVLTDGTLGPGDGCVAWRIPSLFPGATVVIDYQLTIPADFPRDQLTVGPEFHNHVTVPTYYGLAANDRLINPDVRTYPATPLAADGYANVVGGELGNRVWLDVNGDGVQDAGELGIVGVDVSVAGPQIDTQERTTVADGIWLTQNRPTPPPYWLPADTYTITVDTATLPDLGLVNTGDPDGGMDSTAQYALAENEVNLDQDFGYAGSASVGDFVWLDINGDGEQDPGEPGIPGVQLDVTWAGFDGVLGTADDVPYAPVFTDASGHYDRGLLPAGPVRVTVDPATLPDGLSQTYDLNGPLDNSADRTLLPGETASDVDFGYTGTAAVGDLVWLDLNADGVYDPGEPGIGGVVLDVTWAGFDGTIGTSDDVVYPSRTTAADGSYLATNLPAGDVLVAVQTPLPGDLVQTYDPDPDLDDETVRTLTAGEIDRDADFGYAGQYDIGDLVWLDRFADGFGPDSVPPDFDDPGIPGQVLTATWAGVDGVLGTADDVALGTATTGADGRWSIPNVPTGDVSVALTGPPATDLVVTAAPPGTVDGVATRTITEDDLDIDFGLAGTGSIGDTVWLDINRNGVKDPFEPGIPDVKVSVEYAGPDGDITTTADNVDFGTATTNALGRYTVSHLPPGLFRVTVDRLSLPLGLSPTYDLDGGLDNTALRTLNPGENATDVDFGYYGDGSAGDFVWWDLNGDGVQDAGEPGLPNVGLTLTWAGFDGEFGTLDDITVPITTDATGHYLYTGLPAGQYRMAVDLATLPPGMQITFDPDGAGDATSSFRLLIGGSDLDQDFGFAGTRSIGDLVWLDINRDGVREPNEPAIGGARIAVTYLGPDGVAGGGDDLSFGYVTSATSPSTTYRLEAFGGTPLPGDPTYLAIGLVGGNYVVALDPASLPAGVVPFQDLDGGNPAVTDVTLAGADLLDVDYAVFSNDPPVAPPRSETAVCGVALVVDPLAGVTDPNGGPLTLVPGSVVVPPGVTVVAGPDGNLLFTAGRQIVGGYTATWQVADDAGATVTVTMSVTVAACGALPATGTNLQWLPGLGAGAVLAGLVVLLAVRRRRRRLAA